MSDQRIDSLRKGNKSCCFGSWKHEWTRVQCRQWSDTRGEEPGPLWVQGKVLKLTGHPEFHPGLVFLLWFLPMVQKKNRSSQMCKKALWKKTHPHERIKAMTPLELPLLLLKPRNKNSAGKAVPAYLAYSGFYNQSGRKNHTHTQMNI